jgi:aspartate racemase
MLLSRTRKLVRFGVGYIGMACNTAHLLYPRLSSIKGANFISMIDAVVDEVKNLGIKRVGILATPTTIKTRLYQDKLSLINTEFYTLSLNDQSKYESVIRSVISGNTLKSQVDYLYKSTVEFIEEYQLDGIVLGCTELPLMFPKENLSNQS